MKFPSFKGEEGGNQRKGLEGLLLNTLECILNFEPCIYIMSSKRNKNLKTHGNKQNSFIHKSPPNCNIHRNKTWQERDRIFMRKTIKYILKT